MFYQKLIDAKKKHIPIRSMMPIRLQGVRLSGDHRGHDYPP